MTTIHSEHNCTGCAIVADQCFWMTERNDNIKHNPISAESLDMGVQAALQAYRSHQQSVVDAVVQAFPERDALSVPLLERVNLKSKIPRVEELSEKLNHLVITHRMCECPFRPLPVPVPVRSCIRSIVSEEEVAKCASRGISRWPCRMTGTSGAGYGPATRRFDLVRCQMVYKPGN